jgi:hypothetical protein
VHHFNSLDYATTSQSDFAKSSQTEPSHQVFKLNVLAAILITEIQALNIERNGAILAFRSRLTVIQKRIQERVKRPWLVKASTCLQLYGRSCKEDMLLAMQEFQTRAAIQFSVAIEEFRSRLGPAGISEDVQHVLDPFMERITLLVLGKRQSIQSIDPQSLKDNLEEMFSALRGLGELLQYSNHELQSAIRTIEKRVLSAVPVSGRPVMECHIDAVTAMIEVPERLADIKKEIALLRSSLQFPVIDPISRGSAIEVPVFEIKMDTAEEYLRRVRQSGSFTTDQDIWELVWDYLEFYRTYGRLSGWMACIGPTFDIARWADQPGRSHLRWRPCIEGTRRKKWIVEVIRLCFTF